MELTFLGATGTVTGSKYLVNTGSKKILVDCGLFQGYKHLRLRNRAPLPVNPAEIDAVVLTHAHLDHSGYLPLLIKNGFSGKVYCSEATRDLCAILLPDSGHLQEEEARYANKRGYSKHTPALPLYTLEDAERAMQAFSPIPFEKDIALGGSLSARLIQNGHILGSGCVRIKDARTSLLFSGDLGRPNDLIMHAPELVRRADYLVMESTYGNRRHDPEDPQIAFAEIIHRTVERGGTILIPSFAVGRAQTLLYYVHLLKATRAIPDIPVFLNSPMAADATRIFHNHRGEHRLTDAQCDAMCRAAHIVNSVEESKALNERKDPMIIISASGMATGGRVLHHLKVLAPDARNTILFAGFQAGGTRGAAMLNGAEAIKIHGEYVPLRAEVAALDNLSAHADYEEIIDWLKHFHAPPRQTFITHGEPAAADALRHRIEERLRWNVRVPDYLEKVTLI
ncbi:MAG: MBL fold metallo-hydrolase [Gammaproteobacteria bacterium]|nr:MBL fold metallo-hydrolase [Gammaproteobacteria bacterium]